MPRRKLGRPPPKVDILRFSRILKSYETERPKHWTIKDEWLDFSKKYFGTKYVSKKHAKMCYYFYHQNKNSLNCANSAQNTDIPSDVGPTSSCHGSSDDENDILSQKPISDKSFAQGMLPNLTSVSNSILIINSEGINIRDRFRDIGGHTDEIANLPRNTGTADSPTVCMPDTEQNIDSLPMDPLSRGTTSSDHRFTFRSKTEKPVLKSSLTHDILTSITQQTDNFGDNGHQPPSTNLPLTNCTVVYSPLILKVMRRGPLSMKLQGTNLSRRSLVSTKPIIIANIIPLLKIVTHRMCWTYHCIQ